MMNHARKVTVAVLLAVFAVSIAGSFMTRGVMETLPFLHRQQAGWSTVPVEHGIVDQRPWQTAETLAPLAVSAEERDYAREAERLADHEVDQAFAQSLRQASAETQQLHGAALALQQRVTQQQQAVAADQSQVASLTAKSGTAGASGAAGDDLDVAKAQLSLDQDELAASNEDLARASGDQRVEIQQELTAREAAMKKYDASVTAGDGKTAVVSATRYTTMAGQIAAWRAQRNRKRLVGEAEQLAQADIAALTADHAKLAAAIQTKEASAAQAEKTGEPNTARVKDLHSLAEQRTILSILDDRLASQQQLATLYVRWGQQVELERRIVLHLMLQSLALLATVFLLTLVTGWSLELLLNRMSRDARQRQTLRTILNVCTHLVGLLLGLVVIFGTPAQMPTILGVVTAGLTVVFQDFILAFCGWFVLMGRNGIRIGDWVEINTVGGEVVGLGLFRTWLLETGNWTANGHPTGRRISFLNGFAIRGTYFNFSTAGQWMWDEIKVSIPADTPAYPLIDKIRDATVKATEADAQQAEQEWKSVAHEEGVAQFTSAPSVDLRPNGAGVDIVVRYVTRAGVRLHTRNSLYQSVVELMQSAREEAAHPEQTPAKQA